MNDMGDDEKKKRVNVLDDEDILDDEDLTHHHHGHETDAKEIKEILGVVSTEIPKLLDSISKTLYNPENAESLGKSVAQFYKQMREAGMDEKQAYDMTQKFMANFSMGSMITDMMGGAIKQGIGKKDDDDDD